VQTVVKDDVAPKSKAGRVSTGDRLITRQSLFDASKKRLGTLYTNCTGVGRTASFSKATLLCTLTYSLPAGQIVAAGNFKLDGSGEIPIVGGTGAYVGAGGYGEVDQSPVARPPGTPAGGGVLGAFSGRDQHLDDVTDQTLVLLVRDPAL